jgi:hypothetical protein
MICDLRFLAVAGISTGNQYYFALSKANLAAKPVKMLAMNHF